MADPMIANRQKDDAIGRISRHDLQALGILALVCLVWLPFLKFLDLVSFDGTYYLTQAKSLFSGRAPAGAFPVGYPFFVALVLPLVRDPVRAGQVVSFLAGIGSVLVTYLLARGFMERRAAFGCALLLSATPLLIRLSLTTYSESLYIFCVLLGLYLHFRQRHIGSALALGVASITRPEALGVFAVLALLRGRAPRKLLMFVATFAVVYSINVGVYYAWFGRVEVLPKSKFLGASSVSGMLSREKSVTDTPNVAAEGESHGGAVAISKDYVRRLPREIALWARHVGPIAFLLAIAGAFRSRRWFLLAAFIPFLAYPLFTVRALPRYVAPYVPVAILFAFIAVTSLANARLRRVGFGLLGLSALLGLALNGRELTRPVDEGHSDLKAAGLYLGKWVAEGDKIADRKPYLPFYAGGEYVEIPSNTYDEIMTYLVEKDVDWLSLHQMVVAKFRHYLWGLIADPAVIRGELRFEQFYNHGGSILIYKRRPDAPILKRRRVTKEPGARDSSPAWSPDGTFVAMTSIRSGNENIWLVGAETGRGRPLVGWGDRQTSPSWSPDGTKLVFSSSARTNAHLHTFDVRARTHEQLTFGDRNDFGPVFSPDGGTIYFYTKVGAQSDVWSLVLATGEKSRVSSDGESSYPAVSPDGTKLAWVRERKGLVIYDIASGAETTARAPTVVNFAPSWSPDGRFIAVTGKDWGSTDIYLVTADGSRALLLTKSNGYDGEPSWSPDGASLLLVSMQAGEREIWEVSGLEPYLQRLLDPRPVQTLSLAALRAAER